MIEDLKKIKLTKGMKREEVNKLIGEYILLYDEKFESCSHKHNWICCGKGDNKCGRIIKGRTWNNIRIRGSILCSYCRNNKEKQLNINDIYLQPGISNKDVNKIIGKWLYLKDDIYINSTYKHNWICKCGKNINNRTWRSIKRGYIYCKDCTYKKKSIINHKKYVESKKGYIYINSYFPGDVLKDTNKKLRYKEKYIRVKHEICGLEYDIELKKFKNESYRCIKCHI